MLAAVLWNSRRIALLVGPLFGASFAAACGLDLSGSETGEPGTPTSTTDASVETDSAVPIMTEDASFIANNDASTLDAGVVCDRAHDAGDCAPVVMALGLSAPRGIALDDGYVYVTTFGSKSILRLPKFRNANDAAADIVVLGTASSAPVRIAIVGPDIYWAEFGGNAVGGAIRRCPKTGCLTAPDEFYSAPMAGSITAMSVRNNVVFWAGDVEDGGSKTFLSCPTGTTCDSAQRVSYGIAEGLFNAIAFADEGALGTVYWTSSGTGEVFRQSVGGSLNPVQTLTSGMPSPFGIAIVNTSELIYSTYTTDGVLSRCPSGGCGPAPLDGGAAGTLLLDRLKQPRALTYEPTTKRLYWVNLGDGDNFTPTPGTGSVMRCDLDDCRNTAMTLISGLTAPSEIALDADYVYVTSGSFNGTDGTITRVAK